MATKSTNVSLSHRGGAVTAPLPSDGPKWRGNFSEGPDHPVTSKSSSSCSACGHHLQDQTHLFLDCPASEPLRHAT